MRQSEDLRRGAARYRRLAWSADRERFLRAYRGAVGPAAIGSFALLTWAKHARAAAGRIPLTSIEELELCMLGAAAATVIALVGRRLWHLWRSAHVA